jgi:HD-like signal output (HDOD) protein
MHWSENPAIRKWVDKACEKELPVLSGTLGEIDRVLSHEEYSAFALARVVLQDPPLTTKVLKVTNTVFYNPSCKPISTVSRAVMILGFEAVRSICTSIAILEGLLPGAMRERLLDEIAQAIHAAVIARFLAQHRHDPAPEEIFVAALLERLGQMVFWSLGGEECLELDKAIEGDVRRTDSHDLAVLSFSLRSLTEALAQTWRLPVLSESKEDRHSPRRGLLKLGWKVAEESRRGWQSAQIKPLVREVAWMLTCDEPTALQTLQGLAHDAAEYSLALGSSEVAQRIPVPPDALVVADEDLSSFGETDARAELQVLQEITSNLLERLDMNSIFQMVLEGIHRGVGMDRTALAIVDPRSGEVRAKLALGVHRRQLMDALNFPLKGNGTHVLTDLLAKCESRLVDPLALRPGETLDHVLYETFAGKKFLAQAVAVNGRPLGLFVADRHSTGREVDQALWDNFRLLVRQADIALTLAFRHRTLP